MTIISTVSAGLPRYRTHQLRWPVPVAVILGVAVIVIAPVIVAALVNGNDTVGVIDAVNDHATARRV